MGAHVVWDDMQVLSSGVSIAYDDTDYTSLNPREHNADLVLLQLEVVFPAATDGDMVATFRASLDDGDNPDVGTSVTTLTITDVAESTQRGTVLLSSPYPYYQIEIDNADGSETFVYTIRYRYGRYV